MEKQLKAKPMLIASGLTVAMLASLGFATIGLSTANAADPATGTITITSGEGTTLAGHTFNAYQLAAYTNHTVEGDTVKTVEPQDVDATTSAWIKSALDAVGVQSSNGDDAATTLMRVTDAQQQRKLAAKLAGTVASSHVTAKAADKTSSEASIQLTLPEGLYLVTDAQGTPIIVSTTVAGKTTMNDVTPLGASLMKSTVNQVDKQAQNSAGEWKDDIAVTNGMTYKFKATFTLPNKLAADTITLQDAPEGMQYVDGSFKAVLGSDPDGDTSLTDLFEVKAANNGFTATGSHDLISQHEGKQVTVVYQMKVTDASSAKAATNGITLTTNFLPGTTDEDTPKPTPGTDKTTDPAFDFDLKKVSARDGTSAVADAGFKIQDKTANKWMTWDASAKSWKYVSDETSAGELRTNQQGVISFDSLGSGTYLVKETTVPDGYLSYIKPSFQVTITDDGHVTVKGVDQEGLTSGLTDVDASKGAPTVTVKNVDSITQLPQTGAAGMTIVLVAGAALLIAAGAGGITVYKIRRQHLA